MHCTSHRSLVNSSVPSEPEVEQMPSKSKSKTKAAKVTPAKMQMDSDFEWVDK